MSYSEKPQTLIAIPVPNSEDSQDELFSHPIIAKLDCLGTAVFSSFQRDRLIKLYSQARNNPYINPHPTSLFPSSEELSLGVGTIISKGLTDPRDNNGESEILLQLLPYWIESSQEEDSDSNYKWGQELLGAHEISTKLPSLLKRIRKAKSRISSLLLSRTTQFSRSAHYMGSKAFLAPYLSEIMHTLLPTDTVIIDLMCGSGAASGYFSREWKTFASDAQCFSKHLAIVQGGGFNPERALRIADKVLDLARLHYDTLPAFIKENIEIENNLLASELSPEIKQQLQQWIFNYPRVNNPQASETGTLTKIVKERRTDSKTYPFLLFSTYYANLFFGVRQCAEIDSLRYAVEQISDTKERAWAMGALLCAISSCAYSYGGHFAQPKLNIHDEARLNLLAADLVVSRGLSVSHEFFVRLTSLGEESATISHEIQTLTGPWERAISEAEQTLEGQPVCIYLDPPYTRDEYSRYYHILETLVRYDYPKVQDKASMPKRGDAGRFASEFATRNKSHIEDLIVKIINTCLDKGWQCLWSYSDTGVASIHSILKRVSSNDRQVDLFSMAHSYKGQGRHRSKAVREYAILIQSKI